MPIAVSSTEPSGLTEKDVEDNPRQQRGTPAATARLLQQSPKVFLKIAFTSISTLPTPSSQPPTLIHPFCRVILAIADLQDVTMPRFEMPLLMPMQGSVGGSPFECYTGCCFTDNKRLRRLLIKSLVIDIHPWPSKLNAERRCTRSASLVVT